MTCEQMNEAIDHVADCTLGFETCRECVRVLIDSKARDAHEILLRAQRRIAARALGA